MKKKLLSLVLAGAMVATTSVSAFAMQSETSGVTQPQTPTLSQTPTEATGQQEVRVTDTEADANIKIEGKIADKKNVVPPSTISISVPTAASFTVDNAGKLVGSTMKVTSEGNQEIEVLAYRFSDITGHEEINVVDSTTLKNETTDRKKVSLRLSGDLAAVSLKTTDSESESGICEVNTSTEIEDGKVIGTVNNGKALTLELEGDAVAKGTALEKSVKDSFTLTLKFRKKA